jgi:CelD/BcsL family acetyltransferase involved in cellulose biosynthesis
LRSPLRRALGWIIASIGSESERIEWITRPERLGAIAREWDRLAAGPFEPFLRAAWFESWWGAFGDGRRLRSCALWRGDVLAAVLPLYERSRGRLESLVNYHSPVFRPLAADRRALESALAAVFDASSELTVSGVPATDPSVAALGELATARRRVVLAEEWQSSPITDTSGDFAAYRERMKRGWREIERRRRKLEREHQVSFEVVTPPHDLEKELQRGFEVEASGWKGKAGTAIASEAATADFYHSLARDLHARGELRLSYLVADGRFLAFDFALVQNGRYYLLKTGYDEAFRSLAPGLVLRLSVVQRCFELGLQAHEFLGADMPWKRLFSTGIRRHDVVRAYGRRPRPLLRFAYRRAVRPVLRSTYHRATRTRRGVSAGQSA